MFSSLSRGSSRVRQAYICSSCLSNAFMHAPPAPLLAERGRRAVFYSTSTETQPNNDASESIETPRSNSAEDGASPDGADGTEKKEGRSGKKPKVKNISSSSKALRELRASLAQAAREDGTILPEAPEEERQTQSTPTKTSKRRARRLRAKKVAESGRTQLAEEDEPVPASLLEILKEGRARLNNSTNKQEKEPSLPTGTSAAFDNLMGLAKEDFPFGAARLSRELQKAENLRAKNSTNKQEKELSLSRGQKIQLKASKGKGKSNEAKKDAVTSTAPESASESKGIPKAIDESEPERASSLVRRAMSREPKGLTIRRMMGNESISKDELAHSDSVIPSADATGSQDRPVKQTSYVTAIPEFMRKYPRIADKVFEFRRQNPLPEGSSRKSPSFRRIFISLIQNGLLTSDEKGMTMKLLRRTIITKKMLSTRSLKHEPTLLTVAKRLPAVAGPDERRNVAAPTAATSRGRNSTSNNKNERATPNPISARRGTTKHEIKTIEASELQLIPIDKEPIEVPSLAYGLERVLFNPGVYHLQDPRSRVFNFDPYLQTIMPVSEFDFNALKKYITSSRDTTLLSKAKEEEKKYTGSTSSMTSALGHFHFLLSQWRPITTGILSQMFPVEFNSFTALQRGPVAVFLRYRDGTYAIDADKEYDDSNILMMLGKSMEKLLTLSTDEFEKYRKANSDQISEEQRNESEPFHYTTMGDFLLRSQLDAHDSRLPGTGMFDLKTRAVISVRMDTKAFEEGRGYQIRGRHGEWESFEREYYDMIRSAFLKYSLQVRMGRMDGIFVAFHNTERIFGFQYISLPEMDYALHGTENVAIGDSEFKLSLELLNRVLDRATAKFPKQSLRLHFETRDGVTPFMYIFAEPVEEKKIESIQATNKRKIEQFEREVLGVATSRLSEEDKEAEWARLRAKVEEKMQNDELGLENPEQVKSQAEIDEMAIQEQIKADEVFASTAIEEEGEENEDDDEDEDALIEELDDDDKRLEEEESHGEETLEEEGNDEENEETSLDDGEEILEDNDLDEHNTAEEHLSDDLEEAEESESLAEQDMAEENLSGDLEDMEEQSPDDQAPSEENALEDLEEHEESESLQEWDPDQPLTAEDITFEEANRLDDSVDQEETVIKEEANEGTSVDESQPDMKRAIARLTAEGILSGPTVKEAMTEEASKREAIARATGPAYPKSQKGKGKKAATATTKSTKASEPEAKLKPLLAMTLVIRNKVNGEYVERPNELEGHDKWEVEYALSEVPKLESAHRLYTATKLRRFRALNKSVDLSTQNAWNNTFIENIKKMSEKGRVWREKQDKIEKRLPVKRLEVNEGKTMSAKDKDLWGQEKEE